MIKALFLIKLFPVHDIHVAFTSSESKRSNTLETAASCPAGQHCTSSSHWGQELLTLSPCLQWDLTCCSQAQEPPPSTKEASRKQAFPGNLHIPHLTGAGGPRGHHTPGSVPRGTSVCMFEQEKERERSPRTRGCSGWPWTGGISAKLLLS